MVRAHQLSGNRHGGRFVISARLGVARRARARRLSGFVPERDLGTAEGTGTVEEIFVFSEKLAREAMKRYGAASAFVDVAGSVRALVSSAGRASGRRWQRSGYKPKRS